LIDSLAIEVNAIAAVAIANAPDAIFKHDFRMDATDVVVLDANLAIVRATDAKGLYEIETLAAGSIKAHV